MATKNAGKMNLQFIALWRARMALHLRFVQLEITPVKFPAKEHGKPKHGIQVIKVLASLIVQ